MDEPSLNQKKKIIRNDSGVESDKVEQCLSKLLDRYDSRCHDDEFEMTEILELLKLRDQKTMTGTDGTYLLYLVKNFRVDIPIYKKALLVSNLNFEDAKKHVCDKKSQKMG